MNQINGLLFFLFTGAMLWGCSPSDASSSSSYEAQGSTKSVISPPDSALASAFAPWDGHWKGEFVIYSHPEGQQTAPVQPQITSLEELLAQGVTEQSRISVEQFYESESPFYQRVKIIDTYTDSEGNPKQVTSTGYNAVQGKELVCVVNKPDEQVIHKGEYPQDSLLIWSRSLTDPLKIEYFYEKVEGNTYSIIGWGYYGNDNPDLAPKTWFSAAYVKQN